eukprot:scaffold13782_cov163-Isochrysis_galbana.AAC.1
MTELTGARASANVKKETPGGVGGVNCATLAFSGPSTYTQHACCPHKGQRGEYSAGPWQSSARLSACALTAK